MSENLESFKYSNIDILEGDFNAMVENCLSYNERDTIFFRAGVTMRDKGGAIIRQAKREIEIIGFDPDSGKNIWYPRTSLEMERTLHPITFYSRFFQRLIELVCDYLGYQVPPKRQPSNLNVLSIDVFDLSR